MYFYYCDGASRNNGKKDETKDVLGSYGGVLVKEDGEILKLYNHTFKNVTNNQMELLGFIKPIIEIMNSYKKDNSPKIEIHVVSDSQYLIKGITEWMPNWKKKGWKNSSNKIIENIEMWKIIDTIINDDTFNFTFEWVKGHTKNPEKLSNEYFNNICDKLANKSIDKFLENGSKETLVFNEELNTLKDILLML